jgi:hypothetical protein
MDRFYRFARYLMLAVAIGSVFAGYFVLDVPRDASYEESVRRAWTGMLLAIMGGGGCIIFMLGKAPSTKE